METILTQTVAAPIDGVEAREDISCILNLETVEVFTNSLYYTNYSLSEEKHSNKMINWKVFWPR